MTEIVTPGLYRGGQGEPLLLLHGFKGTWHQWAPILPALSASYEVIAPTLPGHYGGPAFEKTGALQMADAGDSVEAQLDDLGVGTAHIVGNSMGGGLALELAKRGRARSVVGLAPSGGWRADSGESRRLARFFVRQRRLVRAGRATLPMVMAQSFSRRLAMRDVMWRGERMTARAAIDMVRASASCAIEGRVIEALFAERAAIDGLDAVRVPTLIAWPEHDRILPMRRHADRFRTEIAGAEFVVLTGTGHVPMWDAPELVVSTIHEFVSRQTAAASATG
ncbi:MAG TPA: alpha/beta fold hydrolase [Solirubrobacteraceae bacterium]|nr:alpha/beta fold hydrolase [Solirubrobacteraceae bacterium]